MDTSSTGKGVLKMGFFPHSLGSGLGHGGLGAEEVVEGNQAQRLAAGLIEQDGEQGRRWSARQHAPLRGHCRLKAAFRRGIAGGTEKMRPGRHGQ